MAAVCRRAGRPGGGQVAGEPVFDRVAAEPAAGAGREQRLVGVAGAFGEPAAQHLDGEPGQRGDAFFPALADAVHVWSGAEADVGAGEPDQFGDPQPGLRGE